ncbi:MAG: hypothetical protein JXM70_13905 [Pirellulales bacterium]|nr:hypothetical protein [Pirellulales bacterium]
MYITTRPEEIPVGFFCGNTHPKCKRRAGTEEDVKPVGSGVSELRIDYDPGYRVYFTRRGQKLIILLIGGDRRSQERDIRKTIQPAFGKRF